VGHFEHKFQLKGGSSTNEFWRQKTRLPGLSRGVVCVILRDPFWYNTNVWHTHTYTHTHSDRHTDTRWWLLPAHRYGATRI